MVLGNRTTSPGGGEPSTLVLEHCDLADEEEPGCSVPLPGQRGNGPGSPLCSQHLSPSRFLQQTLSIAVSPDPTARSHSWQTAAAKPTLNPQT